MLDDQAMAEAWFIRVDGKEYGPADVETLREWKADGRVLPTNEARPAGVDLWMTAAEIPGLFQNVALPASPPVQVEYPVERESHRSFRQILGQTLSIYRAGFFQFLGLTLLMVVPSVCAQLTAAFVNTGPNVDVDLRTVAAGLFSLSMFVLTIALWPIYIAGIQILSAEFAAGRPLGFFAALNQAVSFWPRVVALSLFVYGVFFLLMVFALIILAIAAVGSSLFTVFLALGLLVLQVWMFGRFFINVLFWQQFAVLENMATADALRASKELAHSGEHLPWFQRPKWRGVFIASLWFAFVLAVAIAQEWPMLQQHFNDFLSMQDPHALMQKLSAIQQTHQFDVAAFGLGLMQKVLQPLLGIAFVMLYLDNKNSS